MRTTLVIILLFVAIEGVFSQQDKHADNVGHGIYSVSYMDTLVFNPSEPYTFKEYSGPKPYFINIWSPSVQSGKKQLQYSDFFDYDGSEKLTMLSDSINKMQLTSVMDYGVLVNLDTDEMPDYGDELLQKVVQAKVASTRAAPVTTRKFPAIIYHHGNGGVPFENDVLFEYLASHGFVIISSYYHWPDQEAHTYPEALKDVEFVYDFSSELPFVNSGTLYYLGHSWGGGVGLQMNHRNSVKFKKYLIYDSSIEHYGLEELAFTYPDLDSLFRNHGDELLTNTIVFSAPATYLDDKGKRVVNPYPAYKPYQFFNQELFRYITLKKPLNHGQFTSLGIIRTPYATEFDFIDEASLNKQAKNYNYLIRLTKDVLLEQPLSGNDFIEFEIK